MDMVWHSAGTVIHSQSGCGEYASKKTKNCDWVLTSLNVILIAHDEYKYVVNNV